MKIFYQRPAFYYTKNTAFYPLLSRDHVNYVTVHNERRYQDDVKFYKPYLGKLNAIERFLRRNTFSATLYNSALLL
jgi:hypothetical protein